MVFQILLRRFLAFGLFAGITSARLLSAPPNNGPELGAPAPPLNLARVIQAPVEARTDWDAFRGQVVVIDFWATWCGPCRKSIPHWNELADGFQGKRVRFLAISDENEQVITAFLKHTPMHSWVGLEGASSSLRELYHVAGIPTTVIVNQRGIVVAVTHPSRLEPRHLEEVLATGTSSLPPSVLDAAENSLANETATPVPVAKPYFEISARRSGPLPPGHGTDCWEVSGERADASGQFASVKQAILTFFDAREQWLDCQTSLPTDRYDFTVRLPPTTTHAGRESVVAPMLRTMFGLQIQRVATEREVYVLRMASTNSPGLTISAPGSDRSGSDQSGGLRLDSTSLYDLGGCLEAWMQKPVVDETGRTNRYNVRLKWRMSRRELLPHVFPRPVSELVESPNASKESMLSTDQQRLLSAIRGQLPASEYGTISVEDRENIALLRTEMAKPEDERFAPEPESIRAAVRESLGLELTLEKRTIPLVVVKKDPSSN